MKPAPLNLRQLLQREALLGTFICLRDPAAIQIMASAGFQLVILDCEHAAFDFITLERMLLAARGCNIPAIVRLPGLEKTWINHALDAGADGLLLPGLESEAMAREYLACALYPPQGNRGFSRMTPAGQYGKIETRDLIHSSNERLLLAAQVETKAGLALLPEIIQVERLDLLFLGPGDLSVDLGLPGQYEHPLYVRAEEDFFEQTQAAAKLSGLYSSHPEKLKKAREKGARLLVSGADLFFMKEGARL